MTATQGRSLYVIDQLRPLAQLTPAVLSETVHLFAPDSALEFQPLPTYGEWTGGGRFRAKNPPFGALLTYYIKQTTGEPVKITIAKQDGTAVAHLTGAAMPGLNRVTWDLKPTKDVLASYGGGEGSKLVHPGRYVVTITYGGTKSTQSLEVRAMPGIETL